MTNHHTTPTLLVVVALLLALNLAAQLPWPTAQAQDEVQLWPPPPVKIIQISTAVTGTTGDHRLYRLWSDGTIEWTTQWAGCNTPDNWCSWLVVPDP